MMLQRVITKSAASAGYRKTGVPAPAREARQHFSLIGFLDTAHLLVAPGEHPPNDQNNQRADHGADQARAFIRAVPTERMTQIGRNESSANSKQGSENEP